MADVEFSMMPPKFGDNIPERGARTEACNFINLNMTKKKTIYTDRRGEMGTPDDSQRNWKTDLEEGRTRTRRI
jgi:hypothetical protein